MKVAKKYPTNGHTHDETATWSPMLRARIPTRLLRSVRMYAAIEGKSVEQFVTEAIEELLDASSGS